MTSLRSCWGSEATSGCSISPQRGKEAEMAEVQLVEADMSLPPPQGLCKPAKLAFMMPPSRSAPIGIVVNLSLLGARRFGKTMRY